MIWFDFEPHSSVVCAKAGSRKAQRCEGMPPARLSPTSRTLRVRVVVSQRRASLGFLRASCAARTFIHVRPRDT
jgi:hypothetical protein